MITATKAQGWRTPPRVFGTLHAEYNFTCDAAASISNHLLPHYWTQAHGKRGALGMDLTGESVFCNPPFEAIREFLEWGYSEAKRGHSFFVLPGNIDTAWYHEVAILGEVQCFRGRVAYRAPSGRTVWTGRRFIRTKVKQSTPSFPTIAVRFGPDVIATGYAFSCARDGKTGERLVNNGEWSFDAWHRGYQEGHWDGGK